VPTVSCSLRAPRNAKNSSGRLGRIGIERRPWTSRAPPAHWQLGRLQLKLGERVVAGIPLGPTQYIAIPCRARPRRLAGTDVSYVELCMSDYSCVVLGMARSRWERDILEFDVRKCNLREIVEGIPSRWLAQWWCRARAGCRGRGLSLASIYRLCARLCVCSGLAFQRALRVLRCAFARSDRSWPAQSARLVLQGKKTLVGPLTHRTLKNPHRLTDAPVEPALTLAGKRFSFVWMKGVCRDCKEKT